MSQYDVELLKLQIQRDMQREQMRSDLLKWFIAFIWPFVITAVSAWINHRAISDVSVKADTAANVAEATHNELVVQKDKEERSVAALTAIALDTNVEQKQWRAEHTGSYSDKKAADERKKLLEEAPMGNVKPEKIITALKP